MRRNKETERKRYAMADVFGLREFAVREEEYYLVADARKMRAKSGNSEEKAVCCSYMTHDVAEVSRDRGSSCMRLIRLRNASSPGNKAIKATSVFPAASEPAFSFSELFAVPPTIPATRLQNFERHTADTQ